MIPGIPLAAVGLLTTLYSQLMLLQVVPKPQPQPKDLQPQAQAPQQQVLQHQDQDQDQDQHEDKQQQVQQHQNHQEQEQQNEDNPLAPLVQLEQQKEDWTRNDYHWSLAPTSQKQQEQQEQQEKQEQQEQQDDYLSQQLHTPFVQVLTGDDVLFTLKVDMQ